MIRWNVPQEVVHGGQITLEIKDFLHQPFHCNYFTSAVCSASNIEHPLTNTENMDNQVYT